MSCIEQHPGAGTFRDPQGRLFHDGERILREIYPDHVETAITWIRSPLAQRWMQQRRLIPSTVLASAPGEPALLEHERVFFPSYPWEWTPGQWKHAASLTLDLCEEALDHEYILKDATPLNILFSGPRAIFVDVLSFERRDLVSPIWIAYAQFVRTFLLPLAAYIHLGWPLAAIMHRRDGYESADLAPWLPAVRRWQSPLRTLVTLPLLLQKSLFEKSARVRSYRPEVSPEFSLFALRRRLRSTRRLLDALVPPPHSSRWSGYTRTACHYDLEDHAAKQEFVHQSLQRFQPSNVLDVGANTGTYSRIAAKNGADVVAWDTDVQAADLNGQTASRDGLSILSMVADFARPTPAVGWQNLENSSLLSRADHRFDCVMMLGVLHHLLVADQIPMQSIVDQLAQISTRWAILEWIPMEDTQFAELCRGREGLYRHLTEEYFLENISTRFAVRNRSCLPNGRTLWLVEKTQ
ncbi:MAG: class I SAM-dependent methyltransferase [Terracidiphilus sp.]